VWFLAIVAADMARGKALSNETQARLQLAANRINTAAAEVRP
jgi:hypothetical protein